MWRTGRLIDREDGFTLIELAVVIVIVGLISALVLPRMARLGDTAVDSFTRRLAATLRHAYNEAGLSGHQFRLLLELDGGALTVLEQQDDGELVRSEEVRSQPGRDGLTLPQVYQPGKGLFRSGEVQIRVFPVGWVDETLLQLTGPGNRALTLRINPLTGIVEIRDGLAVLQ